MKALSNRLVLALAGIATSALGFTTTACSSSNSGPGTSGDSNGGQGGGSGSACTSNSLSISFPTMYSAFIDGSTAHTFALPAIVNGVSGATVNWSASDPSMVTIDPGDTSGGALITMQKSGDVTIMANVNGACGSAPLHITAATEAQWQAGSMRYNNGNKLPSVSTDGGLPTIPPTGFQIDPPGMPPACTNCHGDTATSSFFRTISHTPEQTGGFSDQDLINIFTMAEVPPSGYFDPTIIPLFAWNFFHKWSDITGDAQEGMVVYLRSLPPKSQGGMVDFGGINLMRPAGAGGAAATGTGGATSTGSGGKAATGSGGAGSGGKAATSTGGESALDGGESTGGKASTGGSGGALSTGGAATTGGATGTSTGGAASGGKGGTGGT